MANDSTQEYYSGLIAQVASKDKFLEFTDAMVPAYEKDYGMIQGAVADRSARMNPAGSQISLHQCSNLHKFVLTCGAIYSKRLVGRFQALTSLGSGRTFLQCVMPVRMTLVLQYQNLLLPLYRYHDFL